jgi:Uma2 family endonuclease
MSTAAPQLEAPASAPPLTDVPAIWPIRIPASAFTLEGFRAWAVSDAFPERGRISFLEGEVVIDMSPEAFPSHGSVKAEISRVIGNINVKEDLGEFYPDRSLLTNDDAGLSTEPDGMFGLEETLEAGRLREVPLKGRPQDTKEFQGTPDWVLEIVSESSVYKDTVQMRRLYHLAGVPEFWLIDARGEEVEFQILVRSRKGYEPVPRRGTWQKSQVFGRSFRLVRQQNRRGRTVYRLQVKRS